MEKVSESEILNYLLVKCQNERLCLWRNQAGGASYKTQKGARHVRYGLFPGAPDLIGIITLAHSMIPMSVYSAGGKRNLFGMALFIECKSDSGSMTKVQLAAGQALFDRGAIHYVARPDNYEEIADELVSLSKKECGTWDDLCDPNCTRFPNQYFCKVKNYRE